MLSYAQVSKKLKHKRLDDAIAIALYMKLRDTALINAEML